MGPFLVRLRPQARRVEKWSPRGAPQKPSHEASEEPEDHKRQNLERRNSEYALIESRPELESQRRQLLEANQWADQAQRQRIHLRGELEMKNHVHQECYARSCRDIEELRRRCDKEKNEVTQQKLKEYFMQQD